MNLNNNCKFASLLCCPDNLKPYLKDSTKKDGKRYIKLTLKLAKEEIEQQRHRVIISKNNENIDRNDYQAFKSLFLDQIRSYKPQESTFFTIPIKDNKLSIENTSTKIKDYTNETQISDKSDKTLQKLSNKVFSEMFVSSHIKDRILMRSQLDSISEVKSELEYTSCFHTKTRIVEQI